MDYFYTVDTKATLEAGLTLKPHKTADVLHGEMADFAGPLISQYGIEKLASVASGSAPFLAQAELVFEQVRKHFYPTKISRINCLFTFKQAFEAEHFFKLFKKAGSAIYRVRASGAIHQGYFPLVTEDCSADTLLELAHGYWQGEKADIAFEYQEVLLPFPVDVVGLLQDE